MKTLPRGLLQRRTLQLKKIWKALPINQHHFQGVFCREEHCNVDWDTVAENIVTSKGSSAEKNIATATERILVAY